MSWVTELIRLIPEIVIYIAPGFLFVNAFVWVSHRKFSSQQTQIVASIVASFLLKACFDWVQGPESSVETTAPSIVTLCVISGVLGTVLGKISGADWFTRLLLFFHIYRSANPTIWDDILKGNTWAAVYNDKQHVYYCGQISYTSEGETHLLLALSPYYVMDQTKHVVEWHCDTGEYIMLDTSKYTDIRMSKTDPFQKTEPA